MTEFDMCCHNLLLEQLNISCVTLLEEDSWKLAPGFLWTSSPIPFFFVKNNRNGAILVGAVTPEELPKTAKITLGLGQKQHCISNNFLTTELKNRDIL